MVGLVSESGILADKEALKNAAVLYDCYAIDQAAVHPAFPKLSFLTSPVNLSPRDVDEEAFGRMLKEAAKGNMKALEMGRDYKG